jgi:hypothetical protein
MRTTHLADSLARIKQKSYKFFIRSLVVILALEGVIGAQLLTVPTAHAAARDIVINEVQWMGSSLDVDDEWIELRNTTSNAIDITGWVLTNVATGGDFTFSSGLVPAHGYFIVSNFGQANPSSVLNIQDIFSTDLVLSDSCMQIDLIPAGEVTPMDSMGCDTTNYFGGDFAAKKALERTPTIADGLVSTSWQTSSGFANLDATAFGATAATPGYANDATAASAVSAVINDGVATDIQFTSNPTTISGNWSGFVDAETSIAAYSIGLGTTPTTDDVVSFPANPFTAPFTAATSASIPGKDSANTGANVAAIAAKPTIPKCTNDLLNLPLCRYIPLAAKSLTSSNLENHLYPLLNKNLPQAVPNPAKSRLK